MRLTPRRRAVLAMLVTWPIAALWLGWALPATIDLYRYYRNGFPACSGRYSDVFNSCRLGSYSPALAVAELLISAAIVIALAWLLARWVVRPVREMADLVDRFGPTSIGLRLRVGGPPDETRRLGDAIDTMLDRLAEGYEAQRRFASNASHELRTPLATQRALIEVSLPTALTPDQLELVARQLLATNERNERLIEGLLTLAETDRGLASRTPIAFDRLVVDVVSTHRRGTDLKFGDQLAPVWVCGEVPLLERLVGNLIGNAVKYNRPQGTVDVTLTADGTLTIINTGPVVPPEAVEGLFEPFHRLRGERLDHGGGVGLGLTIVRSIVAAHGGWVRAEPGPDGGLAVRVQLPVSLRCA